MSAQQRTRSRRATPQMWALVVAGTAVIAATYGLVRLAFGLHLPEMSREFGLGIATLGLISAGASVVYGLAACAGFLVGDRFPRALVLAAGLTAGGGSIGIALTHDVGIFSACAIVSSAGAGCASPGLVRIIHRAASPGDRATMQSVVNAGTGPGLVAAGCIAWSLAPDWRLAWVIAGGVTALATIAVLWLGREQASEAVEARSALRLPPAAWWASHRAALLAAAAFGFGAAAVWNYGRTALIDAGASAGVSLLAWVLLGVGGTAVILTAPLVRRLRPRSLWAVSTIPAAVSTAALGVSSGSPLLAGAVCAVFGWGYVTATGALIEWTTQIDGSRAATGTAVLFVVFMIGQAAGAAVVGALVAQLGYSGAFGVAAAAACAAGVLGYERQARRVRIR